MLRLSIVIPALGDFAALESGLVSVLEHRPPASEVVVVFNSRYADPYHLSDEIRFVDLPASAGWMECVLAGCRTARGQIVHLLAAGLEVRTGWADEALARFADPRVACVAPLLIDDRDPDRVVSAGWGYDRGGRPYPIAAGLETSAARHSTVEPVLAGPTRLAGFYRNEVLDEVAELSTPGVGDELAFVALGAKLQAAGHHVVPAEDSRIAVPLGSMPPVPSSFRQALEQECLFWRLAALDGLGGSLARHAVLLAGEAARALAHPRELSRLAGRALGMIAMLGLRRHNDLLVEPTEASVIPLEGPHRRVDVPHAAAASQTAVSRARSA